MWYKGRRRPDDTLTRAQFTALVVRALQLPPATPAGLPFADVHPTPPCRRDSDTRFPFTRSSPHRFQPGDR